MDDRIRYLMTVIADAKKEMEEIRKTCKHEETGEYNYAYERPPNYGIAKLCKTCGEHIRNTGKSVTWQSVDTNKQQE